MAFCCCWVRAFLQRRSVVMVRHQRLYSLVSLPAAEQHALTVQVPPGVSAYDFTFG